MNSATREYARLPSPRHRFHAYIISRGFFDLVWVAGEGIFSLLHYNIILWYNVARAILWIMKTESVKLGKNMKRIRISKGLTQGDIFRSLGVSRGFISNIESGKTNPTLSTIAKLAKALGVSVDELLK